MSRTELMLEGQVGSLAAGWGYASIGGVANRVYRHLAESEILKVGMASPPRAIESRVADFASTGLSCLRERHIPGRDLHLIHRHEWPVVIARMKAATTAGGYNLTGAMTDKAPEPEDQRGLWVGMFREGELPAQYADWQVLEDKILDFEHQHPDGPRHRHTGESIVARKPA